ncbi:MAG: GntR family transcriptional regulator, partial [Streptosporangiaceae bacterium]
MEGMAPGGAGGAGSALDTASAVDTAGEHGPRLAGLILAEWQRAGLGPGSRLPTERQLALELGVTRSSVRHALALLEAQGRISREVGRGTFLREPAAGGSR